MSSDVERRGGSGMDYRSGFNPAIVQAGMRCEAGEFGDLGHLNARDELNFIVQYNNASTASEKRAVVARWKRGERYPTKYGNDMAEKRDALEQKRTDDDVTWRLKELEKMRKGFA